MNGHVSRGISSAAPFVPSSVCMVFGIEHVSTLSPLGTFFTHAALQSLRLYPFTNGWHPFVVAAEIIYFIFLFYYMVVQMTQASVYNVGHGKDQGWHSSGIDSSEVLLVGWGGRTGPYFCLIETFQRAEGKLMRKQKWGYFCSKWNLLELAIILVSWSALAVFVKRAVLVERDLQRYRSHREE
ncbi:Hypothetical predicted protein [Marmota monax]|uniref:Polycystin cation channel PKD1/PKD2 domain-containing protein n=1 Tax=Marmota monax TaxID=9995 RepID=A0A5E4A2B0_MARMO|nr:hypothetical protein GHT09_000746 [Marmota monax]VTJ51258.1 Hypothetical predicted protein [Marmota monax]